MSSSFTTSVMLVSTKQHHFRDIVACQLIVGCKGIVVSHWLRVQNILSSKKIGFMLKPYIISTCQISHNTSD